MFNSWGLVNAYGTYQSYYKQHIFPTANSASLNLIGAMQCFIVLTLSIVVGRILDAGHFYRLTLAGAFLVTLASFLLSLQAITSQYAYVLLTQGVLKALGMSCMFVPSSQSEYPQLGAVPNGYANTEAQLLQDGSQSGRSFSWESLQAVRVSPA